VRLARLDIGGLVERRVGRIIVGCWLLVVGGWVGWAMLLAVICWMLVLPMDDGWMTRHINSTRLCNTATTHRIHRGLAISITPISLYTRAT
jgi:hypothetical protein